MTINLEEGDTVPPMFEDALEKLRSRRKQYECDVCVRCGQTSVKGVGNGSGT